VAAAYRDPSPPCVIAPLGILYLCSALRARFGGSLDIVVENLATAVRSVDDIPEFVKRCRPDIVGISSSLVEENEAVLVARAARQTGRKTVVVIGGPYVTCSPQRALEKTGADFGVIGEGEESFSELVDALRTGRDPGSVAGTAFLDRKGKVKLAPPARPIEHLDALPHPAWDAIPVDTYSRLFNFNDMPTLYPRYMPIMTSRGCPYRCSFCHNVFGKKFRARSPENVLQEIELLYDRFGVEEFHVVDDIFNFDPRRMESICRLIIGRGLKIGLAFPNGLRGDILTRKRLELLRNAGCYAITLALESASPRIQKLMRKNINLDRLRAAARDGSELGIIMSCFVMFGYPGETREEMETTIRWVRDSAFDFPRYCVASPFPDTLLAEHARRVGFDPDTMDTQASQYDQDNRGLSSMTYREFNDLLHRGIGEIMNEPNRRRRLEAIWARWEASSLPFFGFQPSMTWTDSTPDRTR
jgi:anaerobic magnesium-protoporphyrin IX monomethyl ester cyclase